MADPFLLQHQIAESLFDIGGKLSPISIRDQMVRGQSIVDRAMAGGFKALGKDILVIGAGAAGVAAAMSAVSHGVKAYLIDVERHPFERQAKCTTRWIDPCEYEWPTDHWRYNAYPLPPYFGRPVPLPWSASWSNLLAMNWRARFRRISLSFPHLLDFRPGTTLSSGSKKPRFDSSAKEWEVHLSDGSKVNVGLVILAMGFGAERSEVPMAVPGGPMPMFSSLAFWQSDRYRAKNCGLPGGVPPQVVISGGGDGALQDFLRVVTRLKSVSDIRRKLPIPWKVERLIAGAEERARRSYLWGSTTMHDHDIHRTLQVEHLDAVARALPVLAPSLNKWLPAVAPDVRLIHSCNHFANCYSYNRFLTLLINAYYEQSEKISLIISGAKVSAVSSISPRHTCDPRFPRRCLRGDLHQVDLVPDSQPDCLAAAPALLVAPSPPASLQANVVIIRHGVTGTPVSTAWGTLAAIGQPRQILPLNCSRYA
jgi:hypothetical protein